MPCSSLYATWMRAAAVRSRRWRMRIESVILSAYMITLAFDVAGGAADGLDQRAARAQVALLVGVEDADEAHLRQVEALAQQVDADDDVVDAEAQVAQDLDALQRVDLGVQVVGARRPSPAGSRPGPRPSSWSAS